MGRQRLVLGGSCAQLGLTKSGWVTDPGLRPGLSNLAPLGPLSGRARTGPVRKRPNGRLLGLLAGDTPRVDAAHKTLGGRARSPFRRFSSSAGLRVPFNGRFDAKPRIDQLLG